jgi:autophagy-related protein 5
MANITTVKPLSSLSDVEIRKIVWDGTIPICFQMASSEVTALEKPLPYYLNVPRLSYLTLVTAPVKEYFSSWAPATIDELWFDYNGIPLKWHYPVGVLYDLYSNEELPWTITVHFREFPVAQLLRCPNMETIQSHFNNTLKEAVYLKHGDISKVNALSLQETTDLWEGVKKNVFEVFWRVNEKLKAEKETTKNVPIRICRKERIILQEPTPVCDEQGREYTLGEILKLKFPTLITEENGVLKLINCTVVVQGIQPPLNTPILWLSNNLCHPDNFLYIVLLNTPRV